MYLFISPSRWIYYQVSQWQLPTVTKLPSGGYRSSYYPFFISFPSLPSIFKASLSQFNCTDIFCNSLTGTYIRPDESGAMLSRQLSKNQMAQRRQCNFPLAV
ncbi:0f6be74f-3153-47f8-9374-0fc4a7b24dc2-CDS [Sclerotinia trifoliorum]|uniref:0f6be74f-3153-47f8-9374-0fc4a7b24dc2-CDS n=1 Tax=Sclerotinia trifoliorum TaxID=28548 RepID=A0A8H2ZP71_9HELO|nr:0f6be74f-3153-47f8-9374-0fc4a7b24dc2-CDS [Sclerotinia trifoliorum]